MDAGALDRDRVRSQPSRTAIGLTLLGVLLLMALLVLAARTAAELPIRSGPNVAHTASPPEWHLPSTSPPSYGPPRGQALGVRDPFLQTIVDVVVALVVIGSCALLVVVAVLVVRRLAARQRPGGGAAHDTEIVVSLAAVQEHLERSSVELEVEGEVNQAIVRCWQGLEEFAAAGGAERAANQTAREYTLSVLQHAALPAAPLQRLADLYEAALFSGTQLPDAARAEAIVCLDELRRTADEGVTS